MAIHHALARRNAEALAARPATAPAPRRLARIGYYSKDPEQLRRQVQELERRVGDKDGP